MKKATIIALTLFAAGAVCCFAAVGMGAKDFSWKDGVSSLRSVQYQEKAEDKALDQNMNIEHLVLDIDSAECVVKTGTTNSLTGGEDVKWERQGDTLKISQKQRNGWWWRTKPARITLTLQETSLADLEIELDAGSITVNDVTATDFVRCNVDAGSAEFENVHTGRLDLDVDAGGITFAGQTLGPVDLECDAGGIELDLEDSSIGHVSGDVDAGEISVLVNGQEALKHNGFGDTVSADLPGAAGTDMLTFDCDAGSISVKLTTK